MKACRLFIGLLGPRASVSTVGATVMQIGSVRVAMSEQNAQRAALSVGCACQAVPVSAWFHWGGLWLSQLDQDVVTVVVDSGNVIENQAVCAAQDTASVS